MGSYLGCITGRRLVNKFDVYSLDSHLSGLGFKSNMWDDDTLSDVLPLGGWVSE